MIRRLLLAIAAYLILFVSAALGAQAQQGQQAPQPATATSAARWDWTSARRTHRVGDVVTVFLDESVLGTAVREQNARGAQRKNLGVDLATPGGAAPMNGSFSSSRDASSNESGNARRGIALFGTMSVRIAAIAPDGTLQLKGERTVDVDGNRQMVTLLASARAEDISPTNSIESTLLADAKITTRAGGTDRTGGGLVGRVVGWIWP